jgi:hypothetical protein
MFVHLKYNFKSLRLFILLLLTGISSSVRGQATCFFDEFRLIENIFYDSLNVDRARNPQEKTDTFDVVFHILHTGDAIGTGSNISDAQIESAMISLNRDFSTLPIHDSISIHPNGVDTKLFFRLACQDPEGRATKGINRVDGTVIPGYKENGFLFIAGNTGNNNALVALSRWPTDKYVNIWVTHRIMTPFSGLTLGGGFGPGSVLFNAGGGGLYLNHRAVGCDPEGTEGYDLTNRYGKVISHEMGHYFGLLHTFEGASCTEVNCNTEGDRVCDTEPHPNTRSNDATCNETVECGSREPTENLMNYSGPTCGNIFTQGQKNSMKGFINQFLSNVPNQPECIPTASMETLHTNTLIDVHPNPFTDMISISGSLEGHCTLYGPDGNKLYTSILPAGINTLNFSDLPKGILTLHFQAGQSIQVMRLIHY